MRSATSASSAPATCARREAEQRKYVDGGDQTACAQTCPTGRDHLRDINDNESEVSKWSRSEHGYKLLDKELNTRPTVTYLRKVRNRPATRDEAKKFGHGEAARRPIPRPKTKADAKTEKAEEGSSTDAPSLAEYENPVGSLIHRSVTSREVTNDVIAPIFRIPTIGWWIGLAVSRACSG